MDPEQRYPRYMNDLERIDLALGLLDEALSALCWIGATPTGAVRLGFVRPARVQKALDRLDKAMTALEKQRDGSL